MESKEKKNITGKQLASVIVVLAVAACVFFASRYEDLSDFEIGPDGKTAIKYNGSAADVKIPRSIVYIGDRAFADNETLVNVTLHKDVARIGNAAFSGCKSLERVDVDPENKVYMSEDGVAMTKDGAGIVVCPNRPNNEYVVPQHVGSFASFSFSSCSKLETIAFYENISVFDFAFDKCDSIKKIKEIPDEQPKVFRPKVALIGGSVQDPRGLAEFLGVEFEGIDGVVAEVKPENVEAPAVEEPAVEEPAVEEPAVEEPAVEEPAVEAPAVEEPAVEEPAVEAPAVEEPAVEEPAK